MYPFYKLINMSYFVPIKIKNDCLFYTYQYHKTIMFKDMTINDIAITIKRLYDNSKDTIEDEALYYHYVSYLSDMIDIKDIKKSVNINGIYMNNSYIEEYYGYVDKYDEYDDYDIKTIFDECINIYIVHDDRGKLF